MNFPHAHTNSDLVFNEGFRNQNNPVYLSLTPNTSTAAIFWKRDSNKIDVCVCVYVCKIAGQSLILRKKGIEMTPKRTKMYFPFSFSPPLFYKTQNTLVHFVIH